MIDLTSRASLEHALDHSSREPIVLYKHSNRCGLSRSAQERLKELSRSGDPEIYRVTVQQERDLSDHIADRFEIRHETPQVIVIDDRTPVFSASHRDVTAETVRGAVANHHPTNRS